MIGLVEFLRARLDEDELAAREALTRQTTSKRMIGRRMVEVETIPPEWRRSAWPPERVLAEVEAKRKRIETYELAIARQRAEQDDYAAWCNNEPHGGSDALNGPDPKLIPGLEYALRCDALPYADHADYSEEWKQ